MQFQFTVFTPSKILLSPLHETHIKMEGVFLMGFLNGSKKLLRNCPLQVSDLTFAGEMKHFSP